MISRGLKAYTRTSKEVQLIASNPHQVILLLMKGFQERLIRAKSQIAMKDIEGRHTSLMRAIDIATALQNGLNMDVNPEISENFYELYDYMKRRLSLANATNDTAIVDEVHGLMKPILQAWEDMPEFEIQAGIELLKNSDFNQS